MFENHTAAKHISFTTAVILILGPLVWAVNQTFTVLLLQIFTLYIFIWVALKTNYLSQVPLGQLILIIGIPVSMALYLLPIPFDLWALLPGRGQYEEVIKGVSQASDINWRATSIVPAETEHAFWLLLPPIIIYIVMINLPGQMIRRLVYVAISIAIFQSALGLIQYGSGVTLFNVVDGRYSNVATGTYLNRDHLAGFLEMVFPIVLALMAAKIGQHRGRHGHMPTGPRFIATLEGHQAILYGLAAILIILCIVFTRSRTGLILTMVGLMFVLIAFSGRLGKTNVYGSYGTVIAVSIILAIEIGLAPVLDRFSTDIMQDLRWELYETTLHGIAQFFPVGSGPGTYSSIYPVFQIPHHDFFINHAHNDYLQWLFEGGLVALTIMLGIGYQYFRNWPKVWIRGQWETSRYIQVGAGIGIFLMLLHSAVDFNLHKPVNAMYFAFLLGVFMRHGQAHPEDDREPEVNGQA